MIGSIGLALIGLAAIIIELFVPAGGLIGLVGIGSIITAIVQIFQTQGGVIGTAFLVANLILVPALIILWFRRFPRSFMGKRLILGDRQTKEGGYTSHSDPEYPTLTGKSGSAVTPLRPSGTVLIEGRRYSAVTDGEYIEKDEAITVKKTAGNRIEVRKGAE